MAGGREGGGGGTVAHHKGGGPISCNTSAPFQQQPMRRASRAHLNWRAAAFVLLQHNRGQSRHTSSKYGRTSTGGPPRP